MAVVARNKIKIQWRRQYRLRSDWILKVLILLILKGRDSLRKIAKMNTVAVAIVEGKG